jgi:hypothetical protein
LDSPWAFELLPGLNRLGRNHDNDFRFSEPSVSSFHAEITVDGESITIRDLGSTNGTFVDERRVEEALVGPENVLRLGNVRLQMDRVQVMPQERIPAGAASAKPGIEVAAGCTYHPDLRAGFRCENCGGSFCVECVAVVGQGKFGATTVCPVCKGQCYPLPSRAEPEVERSNLLSRLTQTLRIPFTR